MINNGESHKFKKGDIVICLLSHRSSLTTGKEYVVSDIPEWDPDSVEIKSDDGYSMTYESSRFLPKWLEREMKIDSITKNTKNNE